jgi:type I restriction enzyme S subunit
LGELSNAFEESELPFRMDVLDWHSLSKEFQAVIERRYEVIYAPGKDKAPLATKFPAQEWKQVRLGDAPLEIIDGDRGKNYPSQMEFSKDGYCLFLSTKNVRDNGFDFSECQFIPQERDNLLRKGKLNRNDLVLTTRGTVGNIAYYSEKVPFNNIRINSGMVIIRPNQEKLDPVYNYYIFKKLQSDFHIFITGSAQPQLPIKDLGKIFVTIPPLPIQCTVATTLSCLDDKIELNNRINANLEAQAQAIFKSWFVDFEPFRDGEFVDSELGKIPKGWNVGKFTNIVDVLGGGTPKTDNSEYWNGNIPFFTPKDADNIYVFDTEKYLSREGLKNCNSPLYPVNTVFITARGTVGKLALAGFDMAMNQSCYALIGKTGYSQQFTYGLAVEIIQLLKHKSSGAVFDAIVTRDFDSEFVVIPPCDIVQEYTAIVTPLHSNILLNTKQSHTLAAIRDTLLPKLMSGEIATDKIVQGSEKSAKIRGTI